MKIIDIRNKIKNSFLYKRFAYNSEGFVIFMKFLEDEGIIDEFYEECNLNKIALIKDLKHNQDISIGRFFECAKYSFFFSGSHYGGGFWLDKTFCNYNFNEIKEKLL